ncbi:hypothetical protein GN958_ATG16352 [Phytophthora infestans]|uniref:Uncharacterized protein n=1 Tax=Phytophthora infestans TaxID=4787 RepID=A0A8S9U0K3_PHYIN|nr:hypothetical protein GN958_ATG16352 [Phytophthora infestans]
MNDKRKYCETLEKAKRIAEALSEYGTSQYEQGVNILEQLAAAFQVGELESLQRAVTCLNGKKRSNVEPLKAKPCFTEERSADEPETPNNSNDDPCDGKHDSNPESTEVITLKNDSDDKEISAREQFRLQIVVRLVLLRSLRQVM